LTKYSRQELLKEILGAFKILYDEEKLVMYAKALSNPVFDDVKTMLKAAKSTLAYLRP
jgi:hypothetical protein